MRPQHDPRIEYLKMCPPSAGATRLNEPLHPPAPSDPNHVPEDIPSCVPADSTSQRAYTYAQQNLHPAILSHSLRVYLLAHGLATREHSECINQDKLHLLFTACILHDIGTCSAHNGPQRFEVEGGDAAVAVLKSASDGDAHGIAVTDAEAHDVWTAIALHTSPGIAERISPLARLVRMGVAMDFKRPTALRLTTDHEVENAEEKFPRGHIEKILGDVVVEQVMSIQRREEGGQGRGDGGSGGLQEAVGAKAPAASWPGILVRSARENPGWEGVNKAF